MFFQAVAAPTGKLVEEGGCPIGMIHLIAVVEEVVGIGCLGFSKSFFEPFQIMLYGGFVEVVDDISFAAWCCPFHLLQGATDEQAYHLFLAARKGISPLACQRCKRLFTLLDGLDGFGPCCNSVDEEDGFAGSLADGCGGTAKRPSCTVVHIHEDAVVLSFVFHDLQHFHP